MKAYYLLAPLSLAALGACSFTTAPAPVAYVTPPATTYVTPPNTVVLGAPAAVIDSDGDGYADSVDRYPHNPNWH